MTGFDKEGIFSLRPLFYGDSLDMKFGLSSSNFSVRYETYYNDMCQDGVDKYLEAQRNGKNTKRKILDIEFLTFNSNLKIEKLKKNI